MTADGTALELRARRKGRDRRRSPESCRPAVDNGGSEDSASRSRPLSRHRSLTRSRRRARALAANVSQAVEVGRRFLPHLIVALLAEGHVLIEDYPGVGKTALARALSRSIDCQFARIQGTSDLLPADVVGTNVYDQRDGALRVPARTGVRQHRARRRDQPRVAEDPVGPAGVHAGAPGHRRRAHARAGAAVPRARHPEPRSSTRARTRCPRPSSTAS